MAILSKFESTEQLSFADLQVLAAKVKAELICENCPYLAKCFYLRKGRGARLCPKLRTELAKGAEPHERSGSRQEIGRKAHKAMEVKHD